MLDKTRGGIFGVAIGDALGATVEFMSRREIREKYGRHSEILGGGWLKLEVGEYTDDTQMTIDVAKGIIANVNDPIGEIGDRFVKWYQTCPPDIGNTIRVAIAKYLEVGDWTKASELTREILRGKTAGNGCLMRTLPISFAYLQDIDKMDLLSAKVAQMTHLDKEAAVSCQLYNRYAAKLITSKDKSNSLIEVCSEMSQALKELEGSQLSQLPELVFRLKQEELKASGYVVDTLIAALATFINFNSFEDILIEAVNLGDDADTVGAVAGGLAGVYYGFREIPLRWLIKLKNQETLDEVTSGLISLSGQ